VTIQSVNRISRAPDDLLSELRSVVVLLLSRSIGAQRHTDLTAIKFGPHLGEEVQEASGRPLPVVASVRATAAGLCASKYPLRFPSGKAAAAQFGPIRDANSALARP
jgi:hypothetical protein